MREFSFQHLFTANQKFFNRRKQNSESSSEWGDNLIDRFSLVVVRQARRKARRLNGSRREEQRRKRERERGIGEEEPVGKIRLTDYKYTVYLYASLIVSDDKHLPIIALWLASLTNFNQDSWPRRLPRPSFFVDLISETIVREKSWRQIRSEEDEGESLMYKIG